MKRFSFLICASLFVIGCSATASTDPGTSGTDGALGGTTGAPCTATTPITRLPSCNTPATKTVSVPSGCIPSVDGKLFREEWTDATCFNVGNSGDVIYAKYSGESLYLAFSATPACGCTMSFAFDPDGNTTLDGDEFAVNVFDDPFGSDGDRTEFVVRDGGWTIGSAPSGVTTACAGNQPSPLNYEWQIPLNALGIAPGTPHKFRFALNHPNGGAWPAGLTVPSTPNIPSDPSNWGQLSSPTHWR